MQLNIRFTGSALLVIAALAAAAWYWHFRDYPSSPGKTTTSVIALEEPIVMPTNGGQLGVAILTAKERFTRTTHSEILGLELPFGKTTSHVQAGVTYRYHIEMEKRWPISVKGKTAVVHAPKIEPTLPVAFDTATLQKYTESGWARFDKNENLAELERTITGQLQNRATSPQYEQMVKDAARQTVQSFVSTWLLSNQQWGREPEYRVVVLFPGETEEGQTLKARPEAHL